jgi:16S rRNA processing protein RimM
VQLVVGRISKAHGIHGELAVEVRTDDPERRFAPGTIVATDPDDRGPLTVVRARAHAGRLLVSFAEVADRSAAEALRGTLLVADSATSPATEDPDEFWDHDLVGLAVVTVDGVALGDVSEVLHLPGQDALVVHRPEPEGEVIVPFVAAIVPDVDVGNGRVVVDPPPGLLDDAEA